MMVSPLRGSRATSIVMSMLTLPTTSTRPVGGGDGDVGARAMLCTTSSNARSAAVHHLRVGWGCNVGKHGQASVQNCGHGGAAAASSLGGWRTFVPLCGTHRRRGKGPSSLIVDWVGVSHVLGGWSLQRAMRPRPSPGARAGGNSLASLHRARSTSGYLRCTDGYLNQFTAGCVLVDRTAPPPGQPAVLSLTYHTCSHSSVTCAAVEPYSTAAATGERNNVATLVLRSLPRPKQRQQHARPPHTRGGSGAACVHHQQK
jgi:hypothetical protein